MAERVTIRINVRADTGAIDKTEAKLARLAATAEALDGRLGDLSDRATTLNKDFLELDKEVQQKSKDFEQLSGKVDKTDKSMGRMSKTSNKLLKGIGSMGQKMMKMFAKGLALNIAASAASLLAVEAAFRIGAVAAKAWNSTIQATKNVAAGAAASVLVLMSTLAAGSREFAAAQQATRYRQSGSMGSGTPEAQAQLRGLQQNATLAVLGADAIASAFSAISANTQVTGVLNSALTALGDFAAVAADPAKALGAAGSFLGALKKEGKLTEDIIALGDEVGPEFAAALADATAKGLTSSDAIIKALISGDMSGAVSGALDAQNNTLFGTFRRNFELIKADFADVGQNFIPQMTQGLERVADVLSTAMLRLAPSLADFGKGSAIDGLVSGFEKLVNYGVTFIQKTLPKTDGMFGRIQDRIEGIGNTLGEWKEKFDSVADALRPLREGAGALMDAFGPLLKGIFTEFGGGVADFSDLLVRNKSVIEEFGQGLLTLFKSIAQLSGALKEAFVAVLPMLSPILDVMTQIVSAVSGAVKSLTSLGSGGALAALGLLGGAYIGLGQLGKKGGILGKVLPGGGGMSSVGAMTVTAGTVYVNGSGVPGGPGGAPGSKYGAKARVGQGAIGQLASVLALTYGASVLSDPKAGVGQSALGGAAAGAGIGLQMGGIPGALSGAGIGAVTGAGIGIGGAAGGALAGAAIGTALMPGVGTAVGAVIGGIGGYFLSERNKDKERKKNAIAVSRDAVESWAVPMEEMFNNGSVHAAFQEFNKMEPMVDTMRGAFGLINDFQFDGMNTDRDERKKIFNGPQGDWVRMMQQEGSISQQQIDAFLDDPDAFMGNLESGLQTVQKLYGGAFMNYEDAMQDMAEVTGMGEDSIARLAESIGVNLTQIDFDFKTLMENITGRSIASNGEELGFAIDQIAGSVIDRITNPAIEKQAAAEAVDQSGEVLREKVLGGTATEADAAQYFRDASQFFATQNYDAKTGQTDWMKVGSDLEAYLGMSGMAYADGEQFGGTNGAVTAMVAPFIQQLQQGMGELAGRSTLDTIQQMAFKNGINFDQTDITDSSLKALDSQALGKLVELTRPGGFGQAQAGAEQIQSVLQSLGLNGGMFRGNNDMGTKFGELLAGRPAEGGWQVGGEADPSAAISTAMMTGGATVAAGITTSGSSAAGYMGSAITGAGMMAAGAMSAAIRGAVSGISVSVSVQGTPGMGVNGPTGNPRGPLGDTTSERFSRTMSKHNKINGSLAGNRGITSGLRGDALGSLNSDHITGGAIDVTGDNLGAYAKMMNDSGGFAEFHGTGGDRHLHTVPGPYGDASMPASMPALPPSAGAMNGGGSNVVHVYPSAGMDEEALANKVIAKMGRKQRSARERMN